MKIKFKLPAALGGADVDLLSTDGEGGATVHHPGIGEIALPYAHLQRIEADPWSLDDPYFDLGGLIAVLAAEDPDLVMPIGFHEPHSWRGDYAELAFTPARNIPVRDVLAAARSAVGTTYTGWKGGEHTMSENSDCWIAEPGDSGDNKIGPLLVRALLEYAKAAAARTATPGYTPSVAAPSATAADPFEHPTGAPCSDPWCEDKAPAACGCALANGDPCTKHAGPAQAGGAS